MNVCFVVNFYQDQHLAARLIEQLRTLFSHSTILAIGDGEVPICKMDAHLWFVGDRVKHRSSGEWSQRWLEAAIEEPWMDAIVKMDPDAYVWKRFPIPKADWFGTLSNDGTFIRGGACGFSYSAAKRLVESKLLLGPSPHRYDRYGKFKWLGETPAPDLSCQDRIVGDAMQQLEIKPTEWSDVFILGNDKREPTPEEYEGKAISHPHRGCINLQSPVN